MLSFERFRCKNAGHFKSIDLNLKGQGLVRMMGQNGAGKSSIWNFFTQNFYATSPKKETKADIMSDEKEFLLEATFQKNGSLYVAAQSVKCKELSPNGKAYATGVYLFRDGVNIASHRGPEAQQLIKQTLGWTLEEWYGYVYLAQGAVHKLIKGTRSDRQSYLSALFNLTPLDTLATHYKLKAEDLSEKILELEKEKQEYAVKTSLLNGRSLEVLEAEKAEAEETSQILDAKLGKLKAEQEKFQKAQDLRTDLETNFQASKSYDPSRTAADYKEQLTLFQNLQAELQSTETIRVTFRKRLEELDKINRPELPDGWEQMLASPDIDEAASMQELGNLRYTKGVLAEKSDPGLVPNDLEEVLASPDIDLVAVKKKVAFIKARPPAPTVVRPTAESMESLRSKIADLQGDIKNLEFEIRTLEFKGEVCDKCGSTLDCSDREQKLAGAKEALEGFSGLLGTMRTKLKKLVADDEAWRNHDALGPDMSDELPGFEASIELYTKKLKYRDLKKAQEEWTQYLEIKKKLEQIPVLEKKIADYLAKKACRKLQENLQEYEKTQAEGKGIRESLEKLPQTGDSTVCAAQVLNLRALVSHAEKKERLEKELADLSHIKDQSEKIETFKTELTSSLGAKGALSQQLLEVQGLNASITALQASIAAKELIHKDQKKYALLAKAYGKAGQLRELQLSKFSKYLEAALLCHTMKQFPEHKFSIQVDDGIDIMTSKNGCKPYDVAFMSGGEHGALSVAFLFALDDLVPSDRKANLKIVDETEAGFDAERKQDFVQFILPELKKRAETVIVISHSDVANQGTFDKIWEVKDGEILERSPERRNFEEVQA